VLIGGVTMFSRMLSSNETLTLSLDTSRETFIWHER